MSDNSKNINKNKNKIFYYSQLLQCHLSIATHDYIGFQSILALFLALLLPATLHGKTTKLNCFRRAGCGRANGFLAGFNVPEVGDDGDTAGVNSHHSWVLVGISQ